MARPPFVDAHVHLWDLDRPGYDWLRPPFRDDVPGGSPAAIATTYRLDDYLAEAAAWNVAGLVHVEAGAGVAHAEAETDWLQRLADARGLPSGIVALVALDGPDAARLLAWHAGHRGVRGIRHIVAWHPERARSYLDRDITADPAWQAGYARLAEHGLSFDLLCYPGQAARLAAFVATHPDIPVAINHLAMPVETDADDWATWHGGLAAFAALPHVVLKLSGAGFLHRGWSAASVRDRVLAAIDLFGPDRILVATNFPTDRLFADMDATLGAYEAILTPFTDDERRAMWGGNADRFYRLGLTL